MLEFIVTDNQPHFKMNFLFRLINPVVVCPTIAAVGISFYSYGFPLVGKCLEIGAVQIIVVIIFSLVSFFLIDLDLLSTFQMPIIYEDFSMSLS